MLITLKLGGTPQVSDVNAGIVTHPGAGANRRLLRVAAASSATCGTVATLVFRSGWEWVAVRGTVDLSRARDAQPWADPEAHGNCRAIYHAAGGHHSDLVYDRDAGEGRTMLDTDNRSTPLAAAP
jgi:hypothetical protein